MSILRKILLPLAVGYGGVMAIRNFLFDNELLKSEKYSFPVIGVGNLSVGGTGKSPMIEYLISLLLSEYKVATLSRGYGRRTSGYILLKGNEQAVIVGDEPLQFKNKYPSAIVAVDENRIRGIENLRTSEGAEVILLDDIFQHRKVTPGLSILLTPFQDLFSKDFLFPTGNLRESRSGSKRANIIVVTKCPKDLSAEEQNKIKRNLKLEVGQELFFSYIHYSEKVFHEATSLEIDELKQYHFTLVTGIANPKPLQDHLKKSGLNFNHRKFPDHHNFTKEEIDSLGTESKILTTEKDYMRLKELVPSSRLFYLPISTGFLNRKEQFDEIVRAFVSNKK